MKKFFKFMLFAFTFLCLSFFMLIVIFIILNNEYDDSVGTFYFKKLPRFTCPSNGNLDMKAGKINDNEIIFLNEKSYCTYDFKEEKFKKPIYKDFDFKTYIPEVIMPNNTIVLSKEKESFAYNIKTNELKAFDSFIGGWGVNRFAINKDYILVFPKENNEQILKLCNTKKGTCSASVKMLHKNYGIASVIQIDDDKYLIISKSEEKFELYDFKTNTIKKIKFDAPSVVNNFRNFASFYPYEKGTLILATRPPYTQEELEDGENYYWPEFNGRAMVNLYKVEKDKIVLKESLNKKSAIENWHGAIVYDKNKVMFYPNVITVEEPESARWWAKRYMKSFVFYDTKTKKNEAYEEPSINHLDKKTEAIFMDEGRFLIHEPNTRTYVIFKRKESN